MLAATIVWLARVGAILLLLSVGASTGFRLGPTKKTQPPPPASLSPRCSSTSRRAQPEGANSSNNKDNNEGNNGSGCSVRFRCGRPDDEPVIAFCVAKELMNPLGISHRNFVVAEDSATGERLGWAQIRPLGPSGVDPEVWDARPGSASSAAASLEYQADELAWEDFEEDPFADFSGGWRSTLPWTKEYREAFEASRKRRERRALALEKEEQKQRNNNKNNAPAPRLWELASVYVIPERRSEGIGRSLVRSVLDQHGDLGRGREAIYALTLSSTLDWYSTSFGFVEANGPGEVPAPMALEVAAGTVLTKLMGNRLVCLRLPPETMAKRKYK